MGDNINKNNNNNLGIRNNNRNMINKSIYNNGAPQQIRTRNKMIKIKDENEENKKLKQKAKKKSKKDSDKEFSKLCEGKLYI